MDRHGLVHGGLGTGATWNDGGSQHEFSRGSGATLQWPAHLGPLIEENGLPLTLAEEDTQARNANEVRGRMGTSNHALVVLVVLVVLGERGQREKQSHEEDVEQGTRTGWVRGHGSRDARPSGHGDRTNLEDLQEPGQIAPILRGAG
jgi:hypothetical protein